MVKEQNLTLKKDLKTSNVKISHLEAIVDTLTIKWNNTPTCDTIFVDNNPQIEFNLQLSKAELEECKTGLSVQTKINQSLIEDSEKLQVKTDQLDKDNKFLKRKTLWQTLYGGFTTGLVILMAL